MGLTLMLIQLLRRFYETHFMQVFSKAGQLNTIFYVTTLVYYPILIVGVRENGSARDSNGVNVIWTDILNPRILTGLTIFVFSWWNQFQSNRILVNLRKDSSGKLKWILKLVVTKNFISRQSHHRSTLPSCWWIL